MSNNLPRGLTAHHTGASWRYVPTPARRAGGWPTLTLKNPDGTRMTKGQAVDAADAINAVIDAAERHEDITGLPWAHLNPGAVARAAVPVLRADSIGVLLDEYMGVRSTPAPGRVAWTRGCDRFESSRPRTRADARDRLSRLIEALAGFKNGPPKDEDGLTRYAAAVATIRAMPVTDLAPPPPPKGVRPVRLLAQAYANLKKRVNPRTGRAMVTDAAAVMRYASGWLAWVRKEHNLIAYNPVADIDIELPAGRIVVWTQAEIDAVLTEAHAQGWHSIAFAVELALELSWSQDDVLRLTWSDIVDGRVRWRRGKTNVLRETTLTRDGLALLDRIRAHYGQSGDDKVRHLPTQHVIRVDKVYGQHRRAAAGKAWHQGYFRERFIAVRDAAHAGGDAVPRTFQDLRDTAITRMWEAGLDLPQISSRTHHSLKHIQSVIEKHYGAVTRAIADAAAEKMNAWNAANAAKQV